MSHLDAAALTFLRRVRSRNFGVISRISPTLYADLVASTNRLIAVKCFHEMDSRKRGLSHETGSMRTVYDSDIFFRTPSVVSCLPIILLFLALPPPAQNTSVCFTVQRFAVILFSAFAPTPRVGTVICCLLRHVLPLQYKDTPTASLVVLVSILCAVQQHAAYKHRWKRREGRASIELNAVREDRMLLDKAAKLPSWLFASVATPPKVNLTEVLDEIVRRLPANGELMAGDYVESLMRVNELGPHQMFSEPLSQVLVQSRATVVRPSELMMLMPKVVECGLRYDKACAIAQIRQNEYLMDYAPSVQRRQIYTPSARDAFTRALSSLALLRHTKTILATRVLSPGEWHFILSVGLCREAAWAAATAEALDAMISDAEARRVEEVRQSGKAESEVSILGFLHPSRRRVILSMLATRLCDLRYDMPILSTVVRHTMPLIHEYCRVIAAKRESTLQELDRDYHIKQMCIAATNIDLVCLSADEFTASVNDLEDMREWGDDDEGEGDDRFAEQGQSSRDEPRTTPEDDSSPSGGLSVVCMLIDALERFFADGAPPAPVPAPASPSAGADTTPTQQLRGSGFGAAKLDPIDFYEELDSDLLPRIAIIEGAVIYCKRRYAATRQGAGAPAELSTMSIRMVRCFRLLIQKMVVNSECISNAATRRGDAVAGDTYRGAGTHAMDPNVVRELEYRDSRSVRLMSTSIVLLGWIQRDCKLTAEQRCDAAELLGLFTADLAALLQFCGEGRTPPSSLNRVVSHLWRVREIHERLIRTRPLEGERGAAAAALVRDSTNKLFHQVLALVARAAPSVSRQGSALTEKNDSALLSKLVVLGRTTDRTLEIGRASGLTAVDVPLASEAICAIVDGIRVTFLMGCERRSRDAERNAAEQATRSMCLFTTLTLLYQACNLSTTTEECLASLAQTLEVCSDEKTIKGMPLDRRHHSLNMTASTYTALSQRFNRSKASRRVAEQLLSIACRMTLDRTAYQPPVSWNADLEPRMRKMSLRLDICKMCVMLWHVACAAVPTALPNGHVEKCISTLLAYIKRNLVLPFELADLPDPEAPATVEDLVYCEECLERAPTAAVVVKTWTLATSRRAAVQQCVVVVGSMSQALRRMDNLGFAESCVSSGNLQRQRWVQMGEASLEIILRYQRWVAPSVWLTVWRNFKAIRVVGVGNGKSNVTIDMGVSTAQLRLIAYAQRLHNRGHWSPRRTMRLPVWKGDDSVVAQRMSARMEKGGADQRLWSVSEVARLLEFSNYMTDTNLRAYTIELADELLATEEERLRHRFKSVVPSTVRTFDLRMFDTVTESPEEREHRNLRSAVVQFLYNHRRIRS